MCLCVVKVCLCFLISVIQHMNHRAFEDKWKKILTMEELRSEERTLAEIVDTVDCHRERDEKVPEKCLIS